jgi:enterochelin esterase-like enzyme
VNRVSLIDGPLVVTVYLVAGVLLLVLLIPGTTNRGSAQGLRRFFGLLGVGALAGALIGAAASWLLSDVFDVFGVSLSWAVRIAGSVGVGALGVAVAAVVLGARSRRILAPLSALVSLLALALTVNIDFAEFRTVDALLGDDEPAPISTPLAQADGTFDSWTPPASMPATGQVDSAVIPAVQASGFAPRDADVYLPPAALVADPPPLPIVIALSGQPGAPTDVFSSGDLAPVLDAIASTHRGLAPIVVVPDQLGAPENNPMCVDGPLGDSATYLTVDVPAWIVANLPASTDHSQWTIAGFSQGGTCASQLGAGHPELFGSLIDISGELVPSVGSEEQTIADGFGGDRDAYVAATPEAILAAHTPYRDFDAYFASGGDDAQYTESVSQVADFAKAAGMNVTIEVSPGTGHDWNTAHWGLERGLAVLEPRWRLP